MKKFIYILILILVISFIPYSVFAEDSLNIERWIVESNLLKNGDLYIIEDITFQFNDKFNGVFRSIVLEGTDGIKDFSLFEIISGEENQYSFSSDAQKGDSNVYMMIDKKDTTTIQIFSPSNKESKTFRLKYTLNNVATRHNDTGELYYKFIGQENDTPISYFSSTINLPQFEKQKIKIFGHGPLNGDINFTNKSNIKLEAHNIPQNTFVEARVLFPLDYILNGTNTGNNTLDNIINEEINYQEEIEENAKIKEKTKGIFNNLSLAFSGISTVLIIFLYNKFKRNPDIFEEMSSLSPEYISPAELSIFMNQGINTRVLLASLFDLTNRKYITMEELKSESKAKDKFKGFKEDNKDFIFKRLSNSMEGLLDHERFFINWIFDMGNGREVSTLDMENYRKKHLGDFSKAQNNWIKKIQGNLASRGFFDLNNKKYAGYILIFDLLIFLLAIFALINNALYGIILITLSVGLFIYALFIYARKSDKGHIQYLLWKDFKKNISTLKDPGIKISKDNTLIYAIALGLPMKELNDYRETISTDYYPMYWGYWYFLMNKKGGSQLEDSMGQSFYGSYGSSSSSSTNFGGGGGFTGGGGGGAGGGGAGGF